MVRRIFNLARASRCGQHWEHVAPITALALSLGSFSYKLYSAAPPCIASPAPSEHHEFLNGVRLYYRVAGVTSDVPVIFLHGGPGYSSYSFAQSAGKRLETNLSMVYLDQRGSGCSERPWWSGAYSLPAIVQDIEALREKLGKEKVALIGHSFGGTVALEYAKQYPDRVAKMVLVDAAIDAPSISELWQKQIESRYPKQWQEAQGTDEARAYTAAQQKNDSCEAAKARFALTGKALSSVNQQEFRDWEQFHDLSYARKQKDVDAQSGLSNTGELGRAMFDAGSPVNILCYRFSAYNRLTMPVLVIAGKYDGAVGVDPAKKLAQSLPDGHYLEYQNSAHFPYDEETDRFVRDVTLFIKGGR